MRLSLPLLFLLTLSLSAAETSEVSANLILAAALAAIVLFFWGIYKAVRTQKLVYALALLPFTLLLFWMFFI